MENLYRAAFVQINGIGGNRLRSLIEYFGSAQTAWRASDGDIEASRCLTEPVLTNLRRFDRRGFSLEEYAARLEALAIRICGIEDDIYPDRLRHIYNPPQLLFYRGTISGSKRRIAIVGSRRASAYGRNAAQNLAQELARHGVEIVSGAARGIDTAAHRGALEANGATIAVLGCGVDVVYPPENSLLLTEEIPAAGAVISEYPPGAPPDGRHFPQRNRIISGLCDGVVVVEAALKSGSLITAELALGEGRDVFAVPGSIFSDRQRGCHKLIKQGAKLVERAADILEEYAMPVINLASEDNISLTKEEKVIYDILSYDEPLAVDDIILKTRDKVANIMFILLQMEINGLVVKQGGQQYVRAAKEGVL